MPESSESALFDAIDTPRTALAAQGSVIADDLCTSLFLALRLGTPRFLEELTEPLECLPTAFERNPRSSA